MNVYSLVCGRFQAQQALHAALRELLRCSGTSAAAQGGTESIFLESLQAELAAYLIKSRGAINNSSKHLFNHLYLKFMKKFHRPPEQRFAQNKARTEL